MCETKNLGFDVYNVFVWLFTFYFCNHYMSYTSDGKYVQSNEYNVYSREFKTQKKVMVSWWKMQHFQPSSLSLCLSYSKHLTVNSLFSHWTVSVEAKLMIRSKRLWLIIGRVLFNIVGSAEFDLLENSIVIFILQKNYFAFIWELVTQLRDQSTFPEVSKEIRYNNLRCTQHNGLVSA